MADFVAAHLVAVSAVLSAAHVLLLISEHYMLYRTNHPLGYQISQNSKCDKRRRSLKTSTTKQQNQLVTNFTKASWDRKQGHINSFRLYPLYLTITQKKLLFIFRTAAYEADYTMTFEGTLVKMEFL